MKRNGMTVVEVVIALALALLLIAAIIQLLVQPTAWMTKAAARTEPREVGTRALLLLRSQLVDAWAYGRNSQQARFAFLTPRGWCGIHFDSSKKQLLFNPAGKNAPDRLIPAGVLAFDVKSMGPRLLRVAIALERPPPNPPLVLFDDVRLASRRLAENTIPWRVDLR